MIPRILAWLQRQLPNQCVLCLCNAGGPLPLCKACCNALPWHPNDGCPHCAAPVASPGPCGRCLTLTLRIDSCWSAWHYQSELIYFVHQLKFKQKLLYAKLLGTLMADAWQQQQGAAPEAIIPVPLHPSRLKARGFNQAAEIAKHLARRLNIPWEPRLVARTLATTAQTTLSGKARQNNLRGAFAVINPIPYQHVALVDDVLTTGSTLLELMTTLKAHGVSQVDAWVACRAGLK